jgi:hypothetical protein
MAAGDDKQPKQDEGKVEGKKINQKDKKKMTKEERKKEEEMVGFSRVSHCLNRPAFFLHSCDSSLESWYICFLFNEQNEKACTIRRISSINGFYYT